MTDPTDPCAVTHDEARNALHRTWTNGDGAKRELRRYIDQCESALTAMTARAEAAEAAQEAVAKERDAERSVRELLACHIDAMGNPDGLSSGVTYAQACAIEAGLEPAPQPAAAPKVLPVEELRREIAKAARRASHRGYIRDDGQNALQALAEELERGGEGKGGSPKRPDDSDT